MNGCLRIAIADDESEITRYYCAVIRRVGHEVVSVAHNGQELLLHCKAHNPDVVVTDITMPGGGGLAAIQGSTVDQVFIVVTGEDKTEAEEQLGGRVLARLTKPIKRQDLERVLAKASRHLTAVSERKQ